MALGGKFLKLHDQNGGAFLTQPATWMTFEPTKSGSGKDVVELTFIRFVDGSTRKVTEKIEHVEKLVGQIAV